jgi:hypothetical protein
MQLSQAIILGDTLKKCDPETWISDDGSCGCALGGAMLAVGVTAEEWNQQWVSHRVEEMPCVKAQWPWITWEHLVEISNLYRKVAKGELKLEDVVAFVREAEPAESTPMAVPEKSEKVIA